MKYSIITLLFALFFVNTSSAQIDKAEKKRIKKELKQYKKNPESYKSMITNYKTSIQTKDEEIVTKNNEIADAAAQKTALESSLAEMRVKIEELQKKLADCEAKVPGAIPATGTVYKVQFGLYEHFDITDYFSVPKFIGSEKVDKYNAYMVSYFDTEEQAQLFKGDMRKMGLKDAFVAKYTDGQRIYEWEKNPKFKGKTTPASLQEGIESK
jgi:hypothetical protein